MGGYDTSGVLNGLPPQKRSLLAMLAPTMDPDAGVIEDNWGGEDSGERPTSSRPASTKPLLNHIEDDAATRHNPEIANATDEEFADQTAKTIRTPRPSLVDQLNQQYNQVDQQLNAPRKKMSLLKAMALGALAGPKAGETMRAGEQAQEFKQNQLREREGSLMQQIENERRMQGEQDRLDQSERFQEHMGERAHEWSLDDPSKVQTVQTEQGTFQRDPRTGAWTPVTASGQPIGGKASQKPDSLEAQYDEAIKSGDQNRANQLLTEMQRVGSAKQPPQREPRQLAIDPSGKVIELRPGATVPQGTRTVAGDLAAPKATPDEQRRADLAENLNENLATLEEIVSRRPDLFGPIAGRLTGYKGALGTNDADIGTLETIKHQIGMAQISAHGMRSAQGVGAAAESILNSFKNGPDAVKASINAARNSVKTFTDDANKGNQRGPVSPAKTKQPSLKKQVTDPLGIL